MKRALLFSSIGIVGVAVGTGAVLQAADKTLPQSAAVGQVDVGGMRQDEALTKLRAWWKGHALDPIVLNAKGKRVAKVVAADLGIQLDEAATLAALPQEGRISQMMGGSGRSETAYPLKFKVATVDLVPLSKKVEAALPKPASAKVRFVGGKIVKGKENPRKTLDVAMVQETVVKALEKGLAPASPDAPAPQASGASPAVASPAVASPAVETPAAPTVHTVELPLKTAPKRITDEMLAGIDGVLASFSTNFSAGNRPRASNIRLAASKLDGVLLLPGEKASFNDTVGRRTLKGGFKTAGVYINGKHDTGVGGGICQVSTTLYNAALLSDLKILQRSNHSLPVPYVPLGRDATVDYGNLDLILQNTTPHAIVLTSHYAPGRLTFRVLGSKSDKAAVSIVQTRVSHSGMRERRIVDRSLPPGRTRVVEPGSGRIVASTMRVVKRDGKTVREPLATSYYGGGTRVVAYNPARPKPKAPKVVAPRAAAPAESVPVGDPSEQTL